MGMERFGSSEGGMVQLKGLVGSVAFREPKPGTPAAAATDHCLRALNDLEEMYVRVSADRELSGEGQRRRLAPVRDAALKALADSKGKVAQLTEIRESEIRALFAVPATKDLVELMTDREIRDRFTGLPATISTTAEADPRVILALARDPFDTPAAIVARKTYAAQVEDRHGKRLAELNARADDEERARFALLAIEEVVTRIGVDSIGLVASSQADHIARSLREMGVTDDAA